MQQFILIYLGFSGLFNNDLLFHFCIAIWVCFNISICLFIFFAQLISFCWYFSRIYWLHLSTGIDEFLNICVSWCWYEADFFSLNICLNKYFFLHLGTRIAISFILCVCFFLTLDTSKQFWAIHRKINKL